MAFARHPREQGGGVSVTRFWKSGSVDYKKVVELKGVDLERYRGRSREEVRVSVSNRRKRHRRDRDTNPNGSVSRSVSRARHKEKRASPFGANPLF